MTGVILLAECVFCGWLLWVKILMQKPALPQETIALIIVACGALHCILSLFFLLRGERPGSIYLFTGLGVYGAFFYKVFPAGMLEAFTWGGIGFVLTALAAVVSAFES